MEPFHFEVEGRLTISLLVGKRMYSQGQRAFCFPGGLAERDVWMLAHLRTAASHPTDK